MNGTAMACITGIEMWFKDVIEGTELMGRCYLKQKSNTILLFHVSDMAWCTPDGAVHRFKEPDANDPRGAWVESWKTALKNALESLHGSRWMTGVKDIQVFRNCTFETKAPSDLQMACKHAFRDWLGESNPELL